MKVYRSVESHVEVALPENPMRYTSCPSMDPTHGIWAATGINAAKRRHDRNGDYDFEPARARSRPNGRAAKRPKTARRSDAAVSARRISSFSSCPTSIPRVRACCASARSSRSTAPMNRTALPSTTKTRPGGWKTIGGHHWNRKKDPRGSCRHQSEPVRHGFVRFRRRFRRAGVPPLLGRPQRVHRRISSGSQPERQV